MNHYKLKVAVVGVWVNLIVPFKFFGWITFSLKLIFLFSCYLLCLYSLLENKTCYENEYICPNTTQCIPKQWICDNDKDCEDGSDESHVNCSGKNFLLCKNVKIFMFIVFN